MPAENATADILSAQRPIHYRPRALDLFCGAGGASMGLHRAGFDVTGVDWVNQPRYPFKFRMANALSYPLEGFDFIWASPPCQAHTALQNMRNRREHSDLVTPIRTRLYGGFDAIPHVIENVPGAPLKHPLIILCGTMFGLGLKDDSGELRRHRVFELNFPVELTPLCRHRKMAVTVVGKQGCKTTGMPAWTVKQRKEAMAIDWMKDYELSQAIPPAYSEFIGKQAIEYLRRKAEAA